MVQFVKVVNDELTALMGGERSALEEPEDGPQMILLAGLQGVGKTTVSAKIANYLLSENRKVRNKSFRFGGSLNQVLLIAADVYRPAAMDQLVKLGAKIDVEVFRMDGEPDPVKIVEEGIEYARSIQADSIVVDTAGRLQVGAFIRIENSF